MTSDRGAGSGLTEARWLPDPHNWDTTDLRDKNGRLLGWVFTLRNGTARGVVCRLHGLGKFEDHPTEAAARAWVERMTADAVATAGRAALRQEAGDV